MKITTNTHGSGRTGKSGWVLLIFGMLGLATTRVIAGADSFIDFEATLGLDDNVTRAADNIDIEYDGFLTLAGSGGYILLEGRSSQLTAKVHLAADTFFRYDGLSNLRASGKLDYSFSTGKGFHAPWFSADAEYGIAEFNSFLRDSNIARASITGGMQIDDATTIRIGTSFRDRDAESTVFDQQTVSAFASLDWAILQKHIVYLTYKFQQGDSFSAISPGGGRVAAITSVLDSEDIVVDDVFDGKVAYKLDADINFLTLGYNWVQDLHSSFDFSAQYLESKATEVDLEYEDLILRATYFRRFNF